MKAQECKRFHLTTIAPSMKDALALKWQTVRIKSLALATTDKRLTGRRQKSFYSAKEAERMKSKNPTGDYSRRKVCPAPKPVNQRSTSRIKF